MNHRGSPILRPSALPKLAACPCYTPKPFAGAAATRGTAMDTVFRESVQDEPDEQEEGSEAPPPEVMDAEVANEFRALLDQPEPDPALDDDALSAVQWAVRVARNIAGVTPILSEEKDCRLTVPCGVGPGTADMIFPELRALGDLKSGAIRNYREQMAAYALALMTANFESEWTAHLLFCDQRKVISETFTYSQAQAIVQGVVDRFNSPEREPNVCEYCSWCALRNSCPAHLKLAAAPLAITAMEGINSIMHNPAKLGEFALGCAALKDIEKEVRAQIRAYLDSGIDVPGWKIQERAGNKFAPAAEVQRHLSTLTTSEAIEAFGGNMSGKRFREAFARFFPLATFPEDALQAGAKTSFIAKTTRTKTQQPNKLK